MIEFILVDFTSYTVTKLEKLHRVGKSLKNKMTNLFGCNSFTCLIILQPFTGK